MDGRASDKQVKAITAIATGSAGGPMAALGPPVGTIAGVERGPIQFEIGGLRRTVHAGTRVDQACEGVAAAQHQAMRLPSTTRLRL